MDKMDGEGSSQVTKMCWKICKYERLKSAEKGPEDSQEDSSIGEWLTVEDSDEEPLIFELSLEARLLIKSGSRILESFFLIDSSNWLKGFYKDDRILVTYKCLSRVRMFRVQFHGADSDERKKKCLSCATAMKHYFPMEHYEEESSQQDDESLPIDPFISQICSSILSRKTLPALYQNCNYDVSLEDLAGFVTTCFADPNFPAFVDEVEKIMNEMSIE